jgi:hypothetical protein
MKIYKYKNNKQLQEKLQVGDRVKIISEERVKKIKASGYEFMFGFNREMLEYCGKEFEITYKKETRLWYKYDDGTVPVSFFLKGSGYAYCVEMFEVPLSTVLANE